MNAVDSKVTIPEFVFDDFDPTDTIPQQALDTEWLLTNGIGGFAMGTVLGCHTRRYHGHLIAATQPPVGRISTVSSIGESITINDETVELHTHEFASSPESSVFHPGGWMHLKRFTKRATECEWEYDIGPVCLIKTLQLGWQTNRATVRYRIKANESLDKARRVTINLLPFISLKDFHALERLSDTDAYRIARHSERLISIDRDSYPRLQIQISEGTFHLQPDTWSNFHRRIEKGRGQDFTEDLFVPGYFDRTIMLAPKGEYTLSLEFGIGSVARPAGEGADPRMDHLLPSLCHVIKAIGVPSVIDAKIQEHVPSLVVAADDFVVRRNVESRTLTSILAGYPWFADWGRDTMISLPGLLLTTGRFADARNVLTAFAENQRDGVIPNRFDDYGNDPHYNTVDASLWFVHAAVEYLRHTDDQTAWLEVLQPACLDVIKAYRDGTMFNIHADEDGLIIAGDEHTQLTWMDAARNDVVFTPRHGKAVEINALWYNALMAMSEVVTDISHSDQLSDLAERVRQSFVDVFWSDDLGYLFDHVLDSHKDASFRPNQLFAVSLPYSPLEPDQRRQIVDKATTKLLTPMGLRTLPEDDPNYHAHYQGSMFDRDEAYHQGTVWAWLMGPYIEALLRVNDFSPASRKQAGDTVRPLIDALATASVGQLHEVFDATAPHRPDGCIAQAWSIAELLRVVVLIEQNQAEPEQSAATAVKERGVSPFA